MIVVFMLAGTLLIMQVVWSLLFFQHRHDATNRALRLFLVGAFGWSLFELIFFLPIPLEAKLLLKRGQIFFWATLNWLFLHFVYKWLQRRADLLYVSLAGAAMIPLVLGWTGKGVVASVADGPYGLIDERGPWHSVATLPPLVIGLIGLGVVALALRRANTCASPQSLRLILLGGFLSLAVGFTANLIVPTFWGKQEFPRLGAMAALPMAIFVYWAVRKHSFLAMGPEYLMDSIFTNVRRGLILVDEDGGVRRMNRAASSIFGIVESPEFSGRLIDLPGGHALRNCPARGGELRLRQEGKISQLQVSRSREGLGGAWLLILHDVTEEKRRQELSRFAAERIKREIDRRKRELAGIRRLEQVGTTAGVITHDFNNFMAVIMGFARAARDDLPEEHPVRRDFDGITATVHRARDVVQQILAFSRRSSRKVVVFDLADEVHEAIKLLQLTSPKVIDVRLTSSEENVRVKGDPVGTRQALLNMLTNAYQALTEWGGRVETRVDVEDVDAPLALMHPPLEPGLHGVVTVSDFGAGMSPETLSRAFEPYFSGRHGSKSLGLGLSTALKIVQARGGTIIGESKEGAGSDFRLYLPLFDSPSAQHSVGAHLLLLVPPGENGAGLAEKLNERGHNIQQVSSVDEMYERLDQAGESVEMVVAPFEVKSDDSAWAAAELVRRAGSIPVALLVTRASVAKQTLAREFGVRACIPTFLDPEKVAERIEALMN